MASLKYLILGYGSMGRRHAANLRHLRPEARLIISDPLCPAPGASDGPTLFYRDWDRALIDHPDAQGAVISSPTPNHLEQMRACINRGIPALVEKPPCRESELESFRALVEQAGGLPCAIGFNYRFHSVLPQLHEMAKSGELYFKAQDDLAEKYGPTVGGTMASHALDLALYLLGPKESLISGETNGYRLQADVLHRGGGHSKFHQEINELGRFSYVRSSQSRVDLFPDESMYRREMSAWLTWVESGVKSSQLATLADGLAVMEVLAQCKVS